MTTAPFRLTQCASSGGCAAKVGPSGLRGVLNTRERAAKEPANILVGLRDPDDAAVVSIPAGLAVVLTTDFITPACDDPFLFGQLAAANALSDVYAMGGRPVAALNICCFPEDDACPADVKARILDGMWERVEAAGASIVGGHTVRDAELKVGLAVTGVVDPARILRKSGLRPGDALILTKPLGLGLLVNGFRSDIYEAGKLEAVLRKQVALNDAASQVALKFGATGATDITGFGLCVHGLEMAKGAGVTLRFHVDQLPALEDALDMVAKGINTRGARDNRAEAMPHTTIQAGLDEGRLALCFDPQTSGPLLFGVVPERAQACVEELRARGMLQAAVVGRVEPGPAGVALVKAP